MPGNRTHDEEPIKGADQNKRKAPKEETLKAVKKAKKDSIRIPNIAQELAKNRNQVKGTSPSPVVKLSSSPFPLVTDGKVSKSETDTDVDDSSATSGQVTVKTERLRISSLLSSGENQDGNSLQSQSPLPQSPSEQPRLSSLPPKVILPTQKFGESALETKGSPIDPSILVARISSPVHLPPDKFRGALKRFHSIGAVDCTEKVESEGLTKATVPSKLKSETTLEVVKKASKKPTTSKSTSQKVTSSEGAAKKDSAATSKNADTKKKTAAKKASVKKEPATKKEPGSKKESTAKKESATKKEATAKKEPATKKEPAAKKDPAGKKEPTTKKEQGAKKETNTKKESGAKKETTGKTEAAGKKESSTKKEASAKKETTGKTEAAGKKESSTKKEASAKKEPSVKKEPTPSTKAKTPKKLVAAPPIKSPSLLEVFERGKSTKEAEDPTIILDIPLYSAQDNEYLDENGQVVFNVCKLVHDNLTAQNGHGGADVKVAKRNLLSQLNGGSRQIESTEDDDEEDIVEVDDDGDDDEEDEGEDEKTTASPKKKSHPNKGKSLIGKYDTEDPFIDDTELLWEEQRAATKDGFFVFFGPLIEKGHYASLERADGTMKRGGVKNK
ncbi:Hpc2p TDEL_0G03590 [Torulaspora delbrueckii]|uniref:Hpc2-related domain-containing protein n=1 Tax=Torulaspora delbrueckii TaxID=4950 RepID=G8ZXV9_TORDE|nr:hypothetical protein TDEL_0G03590 [Torulaspora delbrueckii]CCE93726.1 hypothetical protein TDEL_0G03590 [Torulaspora delbrueckii]